MKNNLILKRFFSMSMLADLLSQKKSSVFDSVIKRYIKNPNGKTYDELISEIYTYMGKEYRTEYFYKNTILNKLLFAKHDYRNTVALKELPIGKSKADFVMINGEGRVYEIKSDLDNFDRLYDQLSDYYKAFRKVSVFSSIHDLYKIERILSEFGDMGESVGIYVLSERDTIFSKIHSREPEQYDDNLEHGCIFKLLRKCEYENLLMTYYGKIPEVAPVFHFKACLEQFRQIPIITAQELALKELKKRNKITKTAFEGIQNELKSIVYFYLERMIKTIT
jgi:hypothetical protein